MKKPEGPPNIIIGQVTLLDKFIPYIAGIAAGLLVISPLIPSGCSTTPEGPKTHEEWAQYCLGKNDSEFAACLKEWQAWQKK